MTYDQANWVRVEDIDRTRAHEHLATIVAEFGKLASIMSRSLGRADDPPDLSRGFKIVVEPSPAANEGMGIGVNTWCAGGHCLYVYDDAQGVCRPCTDADERICQQPSPIPTPHPDVILPE